MADYTFDIGVYGSAFGAHLAAAQASKRGHSVVRLYWDPCDGGMSAGGLGGVMDFIREPHRAQNGLTRWLFQRATELWIADNPGWDQIADPMTYWDGWNPQTFMNLGRIYWTPNSGRQLMAELQAMHPSTVVGQIWIDRVVHHDDSSMTVILTNGDTYTAKNWQDASYTVDLARKAGVTMNYGRDATVTFNEEKAGRAPRYREFTRDDSVDDKGNLFAHMRTMPPRDPIGAADRKLQTFVYRMTVSKHANRIPFPQPPNYRAKDFDWLREMANANNWSKFTNISTHRRTNAHIYSCNFPAMTAENWGYPEAHETREQRLAYWDHHFYLQSGMYWVAGNDPLMPAALRADVQTYGLPHDQNQGDGEWYGTPGWSACFYEREVAHIIGDDVLTLKNILDKKTASTLPDPINLHGYPLDSHAVHTWPSGEGTISYDEGHVGVETQGQYQVGLSHVKAPKGQAPNLVVSWGFSQSRTALCSTRIEPPYYQQAEVCGLIQALAVEHEIATADVPYSLVLPELTELGAWLSPSRAD